MNGEIRPSILQLKKKNVLRDINVIAKLAAELSCIHRRNNYFCSNIEYNESVSPHDDNVHASNAIYTPAFAHFTLLLSCTSDRMKVGDHFCKLISDIEIVTGWERERACACDIEQRRKQWNCLNDRKELAPIRFLRQWLSSRGSFPFFSLRAFYSTQLPLHSEAASLLSFEYWWTPLLKHCERWWKTLAAWGRLLWRSACCNTWCPRGRRCDGHWSPCQRACAIRTFSQRCGCRAVTCVDTLCIDWM